MACAAFNTQSLILQVRIAAYRSCEQPLQTTQKKVLSEGNAFCANAIAKSPDKSQPSKPIQFCAVTKHSPRNKRQRSSFKRTMFISAAISKHRCSFIHHRDE